MKFGIKVDDDVSEMLFDSNEVLGKIIAIDMIQKGLINKYKSQPILRKKEIELSDGNMYDENRLLKYEIIRNKRLDLDESKLLYGDLFHSTMLEKGIGFYFPERNDANEIESDY